MLLHVPAVLTATEVAQFREALERASWIDGRATAGPLSATVKQNDQLQENDPTARRLGALVLAALEHNPTFLSAALPAKIVPPLFNRHAAGQGYGPHVDGSIRPVAGSSVRVRTDLAATLFLSAPDEYDGGELEIGSGAEAQTVKLPAGDLILYRAGTVHQVRPVTRGTRLASFLWVESLVREESRRRLLFELDHSIQSLAAEFPRHRAVVELTSVYHNLIREWGSV